MPVQAIAAPASVVSLQFTITTASSSVADAAPPDSQSTQFEVPYNDTPVAARGIPLPGFPQQDALMLVVLSIRCTGIHGVEQEHRYWNSRAVGLLMD